MTQELLFVDLKEEDRYQEIYLISVFESPNGDDCVFGGLISQSIKVNDNHTVTDGMYFDFTYLYSSDINDFYLAMKPSGVNGFIHLDGAETINMFSSAIKELYKMAKENSRPIPKRKGIDYD